MAAPLFWIVWCVNGGSPTVKHDDFAGAKAEAQRLARNNPGRTFVVCAAAIGYAKRDLDEIRFQDAQDFCLDDEVPF